MPKSIESLTRKQLTSWAANCLRLRHLHAQVSRELSGGSIRRARELSERAERRVVSMLEELVEAGASMPDGYDPKQRSTM